MASALPDESPRRPRPRAGLASVVLDDEMVVYDSTTRTLHHLNATATLVWQQCDGRHAVDAIARQIAETITGGHAEESDAIQADVLALVDQLSAAALLVSEPVN